MNDASSSDLFGRLDELNQIGIALSREKDINRLLEAILVAAKMITNAERKNTSEPMNIQNSREDALSSFGMAGISLYLVKNSTSGGRVNNKRSPSNCAFIPRSVKACTELSPSIPLRVRKVE